jgi:hypothetical protein
MKLLCRLIGHRWVRIWEGGPEAKGAPFMQCVRCHEIGYGVEK